MVEGIEVERRSPFGDNPVVGERGAQTQRRILTAALQVFAENGYHDSRIEQITAAAGCSRPTFYQYFSSKEDVFRALAFDVGRSVVEMTEELGPVTADAEGRAAVQAWVRDFGTFYDAHAPVFLAFSAAVRTDAGLTTGSAAVSKVLGHAMGAHLDLDTRSVDRGVMASVVVTMLVRANLLRWGTPGLVKRGRFTDSLGAQLHRVLLGPSAVLDGDDGTGASVPARLRAAATAPVVTVDGSPRSLSPQGEQMRRRLLDAGSRVFPQRGFHDTRVDDVVQTAGASHGSFYRYFDSKEDLFGVLANEAVSPLIAAMERFPASGDVADLREWSRGWFDLYAQHGGIIALWREAEFSDPALEELTGRVADAALGSLVALLDENGVGDPLVNAMSLVGLLETVPHHVHAFGYFSETAAVDALVAIIRRGFLGLPTGL